MPVALTTLPIRISANGDTPDGTISVFRNPWRVVVVVASTTLRASTRNTYCAHATAQQGGADYENGVTGSTRSTANALAWRNVRLNWTQNARRDLPGPVRDKAQEVLLNAMNLPENADANPNHIQDLIRSAEIENGRWISIYKNPWRAVLSNREGPDISYTNATLDPDNTINGEWVGLTPNALPIGVKQRMYLMLREDMVRLHPAGRPLVDVFSDEDRPFSRDGVGESLGSIGRAAREAQDRAAREDAPDDDTVTLPPHRENYRRDAGDNNVPDDSPDLAPLNVEAPRRAVDANMSEASRARRKEFFTGEQLEGLVSNPGHGFQKIIIRNSRIEFFALRLGTLARTGACSFQHIGKVAIGLMPKGTEIRRTPTHLVLEFARTMRLRGTCNVATTTGVMTKIDIKPLVKTLADVVAGETVLVGPEKAKATFMCIMHSLKESRDKAWVQMIREFPGQEKPSRLSPATFDPRYVYPIDDEEDKPAQVLRVPDDEEI